MYFSRTRPQFTSPQHIESSRFLNPWGHAGSSELQVLDSLLQGDKPSNVDAAVPSLGGFGVVYRGLGRPTERMFHKCEFPFSLRIRVRIQKHPAAKYTHI